MGEDAGASKWFSDHHLDFVSQSNSQFITKRITKTVRTVTIRRTLTIMNLEFLRVIWSVLDQSWVATKSVKEGVVEIEMGDKLLAEGSMLGQNIDHLLEIKALPVVLTFQRKTAATDSSHIEGMSSS